MTLSGRRSAAVSDGPRPPWNWSAAGVKPSGIARRGALGAQLDDRLQQLATMADRGDAELLEVVGRQSRQYFGVDVILAECRLVSFKAEVSKPACDIHGRSLGWVTLKLKLRPVGAGMSRDKKVGLPDRRRRFILPPCWGVGRVRF
jgi:hypothetical protein